MAASPCKLRILLALNANLQMFSRYLAINEPRAACGITVEVEDIARILFVFLPDSWPTPAVQRSRILLLPASRHRLDTLPSVDRSGRNTLA